MKTKLCLITLGIFMSILTYGQKQEKVYYDKNWKVCTKTNAEYYRLITYDTSSKSIVKVRDYFLTGELQWEGSCTYVDKYDSSKDKQDGFCVFYYKSGKKKKEYNMVSGVPNGWMIDWYENGQKAGEGNTKNGLADGVLIENYESGKLRFKMEFKDGKNINKWYIDCDEFEKCQKVFYEGFKDNSNGWTLINNDESTCELAKDGGLSMKTTRENGLSQIIYLPIDIDKEFTIETKVEFKSGDSNSVNGLVWGLKDWNNYNYFFICPKGYFLIGSKKDGVNLILNDWEGSALINQNFATNKIIVSKIGNKCIYSINGEVVSSEIFSSFRGNYIGFRINGKNGVIFKDFAVRQNI